MSADVRVLCEIDELMEPMNRDELADKKNFTVEKLSVAL
jgi:hypothetical protein